MLSQFYFPSARLSPLILILLLLLLIFLSFPCHLLHFIQLLAYK